MNTVQSTLLFLIAIAFLLYGYNCIFSEKMVAEFKRFGLIHQRVMTGVLQILGATGLLTGLFFPLIGGFAAGGLTLLMLLGFGVRIKLRDSVAESLPSFILMLLNGYLCWVFYQI